MTHPFLPSVPTPEDDRPYLRARAICFEQDALIMGRIRSAQAAGFSHDHNPISDDQQRAWWRKHFARLSGWLYEDGDRNVVGYGLLRQEDDGRWYSSVAVDPAHTGHGYGRTITTHLVTFFPFEVWASARNDNPAAQRLHDDLIWDVLGADNDLTFYRTKPKVRMHEEPQVRIDKYGRAC